jgi:hypothetical protein
MNTTTDRSSPDAPSSEAVMALLERAMAMVSALCKPRGTEGARDWIMHIPARPDHDPDIVIGSALRASRNFVAAVRAGWHPAPQAAAEVPSLASAPLPHQDEIARLTADRDAAQAQAARVIECVNREASGYLAQRDEFREMAADIGRTAHRFRKERDAAQATAERLRAALSDLKECVRIDHLDMGGNHRYHLRRNGRELREVLERCDAALEAASDSAKDKETGNG